MAVYTHITRAQLENFLSGYDLGTLESFKGIEQGVENSNYHVFTDRGHYILTLFESRVQVSDLPFFFGLTDHLSHKGINCPHALPDKTGTIFNRIADRPAVLVSFLPGEDIVASALTPDHCAQLGAFVARLHEAVSDFKPVRANAMGLPAWKELAAQSAARAHEVEDGLADLLRNEIASIEANWPSGSELPKRAVHADIFPDNVFFENGQISGILDFYFSCTDFLVYDLALVINAWCFDAHHNFNQKCYKSLMDAYQSLRPLTQGEADNLNLMLRAASVRIIVTRLQAWLNQNPGDIVKPKDPRDYIARLKFHQGAAQ